jgi:hypothetical protein
VTASFKVSHRPFLVAVGNDHSLIVGRSLSLNVTDPRYQPVADRIREYGLVLLAQNLVTKAGLYGQVEQSYWTTPEARNLLLMNTEESQPA